jgi:hypothetical protein
MRRLEFTCDGCNLVSRIDLPADCNADFLPEGWIAHKIVADENGVQVYEIAADLCGECTVKLRHAANPANWPKLDPAVRQFARR